MEKFQLSLLFKIIGIGSASGLVYQENKLFIISDSSTYLYEYHISEEKLNKIALLGNAQENIPKKQKPDFESISQKGNDIIIMGSGTTENRNQIFTYDTNSKKIKEKSFAPFYEKIKSELSIKDDELNIEGLIVTNKTIYFLQRGNGYNSKNGIIYADDDPENPKFKFIPFDLPKIKNVETTFTDGILVDNKIYFLATAEATLSTYDDGEILGSIIGRIDLENMTIDFTEKITNTKKFEGITLFSKSASQIEFLLCEDNDTKILESDIYKLVLHLNQ